MIKEIALPAKQVALLAAAQVVKDRAQRELDLIIAAVMAGLGTEGQIVTIDTEKSTVGVETPDDEAFKAAHAAMPESGGEIITP